MAIRIVFAERGSFVDVDHDYEVYGWDGWASLIVGENKECIHSPKLKIRIPEVMVLSHYSKIPVHRLRLTKKNIMFRDLYKCQYTGKELKPSELDIDHVVPQSRGGKNTWENLVVTSIKLNRKKDNKTLEEAGLTLIREPKRPKAQSFFLDPRMDIPETWKKFI